MRLRRIDPRVLFAKTFTVIFGPGATFLGRTFHSRINKAGNMYLDRAMVDAVWPAIQKVLELIQYCYRLALRERPKPAIAVSAKARRQRGRAFMLAEQENDRILIDALMTSSVPQVSMKDLRGEERSGAVQLIQ